MLDLHVIIGPHTPDLWVGKCLHSIATAADNAPFDVDVHIAPYHKGHIGKARRAGYWMGDQPYVTCVDDDDWLEPDAFAGMLEPMQGGAPSIYTREIAWQNDKPTYPKLRQHLRVFQRDIVFDFDFDPWPALESTALIAHADRYGEPHYIDHLAYNRRLRPDSAARRIAALTPGLMERAKALGEVHRV